MFNTILMTTGISIFSQNNIIGKYVREKKLIGFNKTNPILEDDKSKDTVIGNIKDNLKDILQKKRVECPKDVSAEFSLLYSLKEQKLLDNDLKIILFYTDSFGGELANKILEDIFKNNFNSEIKSYKIADFDVNKNNKREIQQAIGHFMRLIGNELNNYKNMENYVCFSPIGGYKLMASFGYIAASFYNISKYYLHEDQQILHRIPPVPISIDENSLIENRFIFRKLKINQIMELNNFKDEEKIFIENNSFFFEIAGNMVSLYAYAYFIIDSSDKRHLFDTTIYLSKEANKSYSDLNESQRGVFKKYTEKLKNEIKNSNDINLLYHEKDVENIKNRNCGFHLYKHTRSSDVFRAAWKFDKDKDELYINYFWLDHNQYENDINKNIVRGFSEDYKGYEDISIDFYSHN